MEFVFFGVVSINCSGNNWFDFQLSPAEQSRKILARPNDWQDKNDKPMMELRMLVSF
jgi:hypothetical protein